jgi:hypothetical protein
MKELNALDYSGPADLANAITFSPNMPVTVICGRARHRVTEDSAQDFCRGLLLAAEMAAEKNP